MPGRTEFRIPSQGWSAGAGYTYTRIKVRNYTGECDDEQLERLPSRGPILRVQRGVRGLRPEHLGSIFREFEPGCDHFAELELRLPKNVIINRRMSVS